MCPVERKQIEDLAKEAGFINEDIQAAVDIEMRMNFARSTKEQKEIFVIKYFH